MIDSRNIDDLRDGARQKCQAFMQVAELAGLDIFLVSTYRDFAYQKMLYEKHRKDSRAALAARPGYSWHQYKCAWDIGFRPVGEPKGYTLIGDWYKIGLIAEILGIEWGGNWTGGKTDKPHFQYVTDEARSEFELWEIEQQQPCANGNCQG